MRPIDADKLFKDVKSNMTDGIFKALDIIREQPTIKPTEINKMYTLGILADIMAQANYMITLEDGSQKLCVDTAVIDKMIEALEGECSKQYVSTEEMKCDNLKEANDSLVIQEDFFDLDLPALYGNINKDDDIINSKDELFPSENSPSIDKLQELINSHADFKIGEVKIQTIK